MKGDETVKKLMRVKKWSMYRVSQELMVCPPAVQMWVKGKFRPKAQYVARMKELMNG